MSDVQFMRLALQLARRGYGTTSPNPMVGAVLVKRGEIIGRGWHRRAGGPHAEIEALRDAARLGQAIRGATLYVTLEPCCTQGRTPPCTDAIIAAGIRKVVVGATDPNSRHAGKGFNVLRRAGIIVTSIASETLKRSRGQSPQAQLADECAALNASFNHWIVTRTPLVTVKAAMTLDGKIATASGKSKWITGEKARAHAMKLRQGSDAILVGVNTILADDPSLTVRMRKEKAIWRIILDSTARTPLEAKVVSDAFAAKTTIVVSPSAPQRRVAALAKRVTVWVSPACKAGRAFPQTNSAKAAPHQIHLPWLLKKLGVENVTSLLVEGGGEVNASFLLTGLAQRVAFFYAPKILGGRTARRAVAGNGATDLTQALQLRELEWKRLGEDLLLRARVVS